MNAGEFFSASSYSAQCPTSQREVADFLVASVPLESVHKSNSLWPFSFTDFAISRGKAAPRVTLGVGLDIPREATSVLEVLSPRFQESLVIPVVKEPTPAFISGQGGAPH